VLLSWLLKGRFFLFTLSGFSLELLGSSVLWTLPLCFLALLTLSPWQLKWSLIKKMEEKIDQTIGVYLVRCRVWQIFVLSLAAGVGEEFLFRGTIQELFGITFASVLFGVAHALTWFYALVAGLMGSYFGVLYLKTDSIWGPVIVHALYDFCAILIYRLNVAQKEKQKKREFLNDL